MALYGYGSDNLSVPGKTGLKPEKIVYLPPQKRTTCSSRQPTLEVL
jgi:hypothetical protein